MIPDKISTFDDKQYLYHIHTPNGVIRYAYRLQKALDILNENGGKLYAVTKDLFPTKTLLAWK